VIEERIAPQSLEAEQGVLGCMLVDPGSVIRALAETKASDFYREAHRTIFTAIATVHATGTPVNIITVADELKRITDFAAIGGAEYLTALMGQYTPTRHIISYSRLVHTKAVKRRLMTLAAEITEAAREDPEDLDGLLVWAGGALAELSREASASAAGAQHVDEHIFALAPRLRAALTEASGVSPARTGMDRLDRLMGGLARQRLIIPRAPTKGLKSVFAQQCALSSALQFAQQKTGQVAVCYILEDIETWEERSIAWLAGMDSSSFEPTRPATADSSERLEKGLELLRSLPLYYTADMRDVDAIALDLRRKAEDAPVGFALVDHAQRLQGGTGDNLTIQAEYRAITLASLADELHCPIVVPSQLTVRDGEKIAKWSRAWSENCTFSFDIERGKSGDAREVWQVSSCGRFVLDASRKKAPFGEHEFEVDLATGRMRDAHGGWQYDH